MREPSLNLSSTLKDDLYVSYLDDERYPDKHWVTEVV